MTNSVGMRRHNGIALPVYQNKEDAKNLQNKPNPYLRKPEDKRNDFYINEIYYKNLDQIDQ